MTKPFIIINYAAARAPRAWPNVRERLLAHGVEFDFRETTKAGDATAQTRAALQSGKTTIAVVGGDGTLSEAAEGFFQFAPSLEDRPTSLNSQAVLAVLPAGTGDDFARGLTKGARSPLDYWIDLLIAYCKNPAPELRPVDVMHGRCDNFQTPFICLNASTMGIGGETAARVAAQGNLMRKLSGEARFAGAAMAALVKWRERRVRVIVNQSEMADGPMNLAAVANGLYAGGGMMLSPQARNDDGKFDVVTASGLNRAQIIRELTRIHKGGHVANPKVRIMQGTDVRIETFGAENRMPIESDGNVRGHTPVEFKLMPRALRFVTG